MLAEKDYTEEEKKAYETIFSPAPQHETNSLLLRQPTFQEQQLIKKTKEKLGDKSLYLYNKHLALNSALESFDRLKMEFEDILQRERRLLDQFEKSGDLFKQTVVLQQLANLISLALRVQGKLGTQLVNINTKNVNVINPSDLSELFRKTQENWFTSMNAEYTNGKLIINNPTPELIDDFNKWQAKQFREMQRAEVNAE
jgi:hypothetical protein